MNMNINVDINMTVNAAWTIQATLGSEQLAEGWGCIVARSSAFNVHKGSSGAVLRQAARQWADTIEVLSLPTCAHAAAQLPSREAALTADREPVFLRVRGAQQAAASLQMNFRTASAASARGLSQVVPGARKK